MPNRRSPRNHSESMVPRRYHPSRPPVLRPVRPENGVTTSDWLWNSNTRRHVQNTRRNQRSVAAKSRCAAARAARIQAARAPKPAIGRANQHWICNSRTCATSEIPRRISAVSMRRRHLYAPIAPARPAKRKRGGRGFFFVRLFAFVCLFNYRTLLPSAPKSQIRSQITTPAPQFQHTENPRPPPQAAAGNFICPRHLPELCRRRSALIAIAALKHRQVAPCQVSHRWTSSSVYPRNPRINSKEIRSSVRI